MSVYESDKNLMRIPDLTPMYVAVRDFVKEHQGDKGFIPTDDERCDKIYAILYNNGYDAYECEVKAVRVKDNELQIVTDWPYIKYTEELIGELDENEWSFDIRQDDYVHYVSTIFSIAENIQEYV